MTRSAIARLARILDVAAEQLAPFAELPDDDLRTLAQQVSRALFDRDAKSFRRTAAVSQILPAGLAGKIAERFMPPVLAARTAEYLAPGRARELITSISVPYLADVAIALDPERISNVVSELPARRVGEVAAELFGRDELAAMVDFVGTVADDALLAALRVATGEQLARVVPLLEWNDQLERVIDHVPDHQIDELLRAAVDLALWPHLTYLLDHLPPGGMSRVAQRVAQAPDDVAAALDNAAASGDLPSHHVQSLTAATRSA
jgi:Mg/Co/Ni transporter MgtE